MRAPTPLPPYGMIAPGNIDPHNRPRVINPDGSISTVRTISTGFDGGEVLMPTVSPEGRILSDDAAIQRYIDTGENFGTFRTPEAATMFAERLHNSQAEEYAKPKDKPVADLARIKRNVAKMAGMGAPEADIDGYIASEGVTIEDVRTFKSPAPADMPQPVAKPGTREYADWAREQVMAGNKLPQISEQSPKFFPERDSSLLDPLVQGTTFGWGDELRGVVQGGLSAMQGGDFGDTYKRVVDDARQKLDYQRKVNPAGSFAAELAGAIPTGMGAGGQLAGRGASLVTKMLSGAAVGGAQGAAYGAGAASDDERGAGALFGGATGAALGGAIPAAAEGFKSLFGRVGAVMPEIDDLYKARDAAYAAVDNSGFRYTPQQYDDLVNDIYRRVGAGDIDPNPDGAHKAAINMLTRLNNRSAPMTLGQLDDLRKVIRRDVIDSGSKADAHFGDIMLDAIDDFIDKTGGSDVIGAARSAHRTLRKSELLADAVERATLNAAATGSGGNIDNALRQQIRNILTNPSKARSFTAAEKEAMRKIVEGGKMQGFLRLVGKLSPSGNGLMAALGIGATAANPALAIPIGAGIAAKSLSDGATRGGVRALERAVRTGANPLAPMPLTPPGLLQRGFTPLAPMLGGKVGELVTR